MRLRLSVLLTLCVLFSFACSNLSEDGRPKNESLEEAAKSYWQNKVEGNLEKMYVYENIYFKKFAPKAKYLSGFGGDKIYIKSFELIRVGKEGSGPQGFTPVTIKYKYSYPTAPFPMPDVMEHEMNDLWVKQEDGRWYHVRQLASGYY